MNRIQRATINMATGALGYVLPMVVTILTTPVLIRIIGEAGFGLQSLMNVVIGYLLIAEMGVDLSVIRYLSADRAAGELDRLKRYTGQTLKMYLLVAVVGMAALWLLSGTIARHFFSVPQESIGDAAQVFALTGIAFFGTMLVYWGRSVMIGIQRMDLSNLNTVFTNLLGVVGGLIIAALGFGVVGYVACRAFALVLSGSIYIRHVRRHVGAFPMRVSFDRDSLERMSGYARFGVVNRTAGVLTSGLDRTLIGTWWGVASITTYAVPYTLTSSLLYMLNSVVLFVFPMASELHSAKRADAFRKLYLQATRFVAAITTLVVVPLAVLGERFLVLWLGADLARQSAVVFHLLLPGTYASILFMLINNQVLPGTGNIRLQTISQMVRAGFIVLTLLLLVRPFGPSGAAFAAVAAAVSDFFFFLYITRRVVDVSLMELLRRVYVPVLGVGLVVGLMGLPLRPFAETWYGLAAAAGMMVVVYVALGFLVGVFGDLERKALREILRLVFRRRNPVEKSS